MSSAAPAYAVGLAETHSVLGTTSGAPTARSPGTTRPAGALPGPSDAVCGASSGPVPMPAGVLVSLVGSFASG